MFVSGRAQAIECSQLLIGYLIIDYKAMVKSIVLLPLPRPFHWRVSRYSQYVYHGKLKTESIDFYLFLSRGSAGQSFDLTNCNWQPIRVNRQRFAYKPVWTFNLAMGK